jgi:phosphodiester glycosidase
MTRIQAAHAAPPALARVRRLREALPDRAATTVHLAVYPRALTALRVVALPAPEPLVEWCARTGVGDAMVGGFFVTPDGPALGEVRIGGERHASEPFLAPWDARRACLAIDGERWAIGPRDRLAGAPGGDLLQAGPALVAEGIAIVRDGEDAEGFSDGQEQFDSDITDGRHPRAALGFDDERLLLVVCDGRGPSDAGLTLGELAALMARLGAREAINLDGGGSAALVAGGRLRNRPRAAGGEDILRGRPILTAIAVSARAQPPATASA